MKTKYFVAAIFLAAFSAEVSIVFGASPSPALLKAKQEAKAKGYIFIEDQGIGVRL